MAPIDISDARKIARDICDHEGIDLITPERPGILRDIAYLSAAAVTPLTRDQARARLSLYVPSWVPEAATVAVAALGLHLDTTRALVIVGEVAWADAVLLLDVLAHELSHHRRARAAHGQCGVLCDLTWAVAYAAVAGVRVWDEALAYTTSMMVRVIAGGVSVDDALTAAQTSLAGIYAGSPEAMEIGRDVLASCAASLRRGELHGSDTTAHQVLRELASRGVDLGAWTAAVWR